MHRNGMAADRSLRLTGTMRGVAVDALCDIFMLIGKGAAFPHGRQRVQRSRWETPLEHPWLLTWGSCGSRSSSSSCSLYRMMGKQAELRLYIRWQPKQSSAILSLPTFCWGLHGACGMNSSSNRSGMNTGIPERQCWRGCCGMALEADQCLGLGRELFKIKQFGRVAFVACFAQGASGFTLAMVSCPARHDSQFTSGNPVSDLICSPCTLSRKKSAILS